MIDYRELAESLDFVSWDNYPIHEYKLLHKIQDFLMYSSIARK